MQSIAIPLAPVEFPKFSGVQMYMKKVMASVAHFAVPLEYRIMVRDMIAISDIPGDQDVWITIDESRVQKGQKHRRGGAHIDGCYETMGWNGWGGGWLNGVPGRMLSEAEHTRSYRNPNGGMIIASNFAACQVWQGEVDGIAGQGGDCEHLRDQFDKLETDVMVPNKAYMTNSTCIHESLPLGRTYNRQLIRITLSEQFQFPIQ
ncbi:hypothetical protein pEaSNUABM8_00136 [Erwinia phage pEa_SNUABM_8]|nr:hypothetical protein pEaSNUABM8_00136 [Erwinia phage pEa_SNUABM_8]QVW54888.1 hypothetical protein pEaSNUABM4_00135 [Erwinia phage pEa_SNUABM_4]